MRKCSICGAEVETVCKTCLDSDIEPERLIDTLKAVLNSSNQAVFNRLSDTIDSCCRCELKKGSKSVFSKGSRVSKVVIVGEAPGRDEVEQGRPFVGTAGKILSNVLNDVGVNEDDIYITNVVKCRPHVDGKNRMPSVPEVLICVPYLYAEISLMRPDAVLLLGKTAMTAFGVFDRGDFNFKCISSPDLLRSSLYFPVDEKSVKERIERIKRETHLLRLMGTYHPAATIYRRETMSTFREHISKFFDYVFGSGLLVQKQ